MFYTINLKNNSKLNPDGHLVLPVILCLIVPVVLLPFVGAVVSVRLEMDRLHHPNPDIVLGVLGKQSCFRLWRKQTPAMQHVAEKQGDYQIWELLSCTTCREV